MQLDFIFGMRQYKVTMKYRRFSAFFLVGFFVVLSAILLSSKPALSDWTNDLGPPTGTVQVQCPGKVPQPLSTTATTTIACAIDVSIIPGCQDTLSGCWKLSYGIDSPAAPNNTELTDCSSVVNTVDMSPPHPTLKPDGTTHTVTLKDVYDCAGNHTIKTSQFSFYVCDPAICTSTTPPPNTPTPTATPATNTPTPTSTPITPSPTILPGTWFQGIGGDMRQDSGFNDPMPTLSPTPLYASILTLPRSQSPGVIYSGTGPIFGGGKPSAKDWLVLNNPYTLGKSTSHAAIEGVLKKYAIIPTNISGFNCTSSCDLGSVLLAKGAYRATGNIQIQATTSPKILPGTYVLLVDGNVTIKGEINLDSGVFLLISSNNDIVVNGDVNKIAGFYSADRNFTVQDLSPGSPQQLIIDGLVVANAKTGGVFSDQRILADKTIPSVVIVERPDMILNTPGYLRKQNYIWQEVTP